MHRRTTPKVFGHAKQLHRNMTPAEVKLWARLRTHRLEGVHFRNQHAIGKYIVDFCAPMQSLSLKWMGVSTWNKNNMTTKEQHTWNPKATRCSAFGIRT